MTNTKPKNGDYLIITDGKVVTYLNNDSLKATDELYLHYLHNPRIKPDAILVQVVASLEYPPPEIKTLAHERMK